MKLWTTLALSAFAASATTTHAYELSRNQKLDDFDQLVSTIKSKYGPLEYKKETQNIDLAKLHEKYTAEIEASKTNGDFYYALLRFIAEFHDGHFGARLTSTHRKSLSVQTDLVAGKVLIEGVDRAVLNEAAFPFAKGDEVVSVDGRPALEVVTELQKYLGSGSDLSEKRYAAMLLFNRPASVVPVPTGKNVTIEVRRRASDNVDRITVAWTEKGVPLDEAISQSAQSMLSLSPDSRRGLEKFAQYKTLSLRDTLLDTFGKERVETTYWCSGGTRIKIPEGATTVVDKPFVAYYWPTAKGNLGYLRVPHFSPENDEYELRFSQYEYAISELEKNTVGLIIDEDHNCGGSVFYLEQIVSLFVEKEFTPLTFKFTATKSDYLEWQGWLDQTPVHTLDRGIIEKVTAQIKDTWLKGLRMTELTSFRAMNKVLPNQRARYTKPIVMLIDENAGSGGDAFPAMMQGLGRAKLLGTRTSGLGGHVEAMPALINSGIQYRMTRSLFYRPDGVAVENNGAAPDYPYAITENDFVNGYEEYRSFYTQKLLELIP